MNKRQILASLNDVANELDNMNLYTEANVLTNIMKRLAQSSGMGDVKEYERNTSPRAPKLKEMEIIKKHFVDNYPKINNLLSLGVALYKSYEDSGAGFFTLGGDKKSAKIANELRNPIMKFATLLNRISAAFSIKRFDGAGQRKFSLALIAAKFESYSGDANTDLSKFRFFPLINEYLNELSSITSVLNNLAIKYSQGPSEMGNSVAEMDTNMGDMYMDDVDMGDTGIA